MANGIRTGDPCGFDKGCSSNFPEGSQTPEKGRRTYRPKCCGNNKDEDNSPKTLNDKNHQASSQKFRQLINHLGYLMPNPLYTYISNMICKHMLLIMFLNESKLIIYHTIEWFQVLLCITNNSIKHQSFVYIQLNDQIVLFQIIQFSKSHLFVHSLNVRQFYLTHR